MGNTLVVNFFAGAGAGKSSMATSVFSELKWLGINAEYVPEFAKDAVWEGTDKVFQDQSYIFGKQHYRIKRLLGEVDVVITDSPILLSAFYNKDMSETFNKFAIEEFKRFNNLNFFINRVKLYNSKGRFQTEEEAKQDDAKLRVLLDKYEVPYVIIDGKKESVPVVVNIILKHLKTEFNSPCFNCNGLGVVYSMEYPSEKEECRYCKNKETC